MTSHIDILRLVRVITLLLAGLVAYLALKSYRRLGDRVMLFLSTGFILIALGALLSGVLYEFFNFTLEDSYLTESILSAAGLAIIVYSIYGVKGSRAK